MADDTITLRQVANDDQGERFVLTLVDGEKAFFKSGYMGKEYPPMHEPELRKFCADRGFQSAEVDGLIDRARAALAATTSH